MRTEKSISVNVIVVFFAFVSFYGLPGLDCYRVGFNPSESLIARRPSEKITSGVKYQDDSSVNISLTYLD